MKVISIYSFLVLVRDFDLIPTVVVAAVDDGALVSLLVVDLNRSMDSRPKIEQLY